LILQEEKRSNITISESELSKEVVDIFNYCEQAEFDLVKKIHIMSKKLIETKDSFKVFHQDF
jgi:hypothetical protein